MSPKILLVCLGVCLATLVFGIAPSLQTQPTTAVTPTPVIAQETAVVAVAPPAPYHPAPVILGGESDYAPPDFAELAHIPTKKTAFYNYLLPKIDRANQEIIRERSWLLDLQAFDEAGGQASDAELNALARIENRYNLRQPAETLSERLDELLLRVDVVPASLVIAQAAKESGWGTSRFAREGNNFFGIWCFSRGCGLTPQRRDSGRFHEVAMFDTVEEGVRYYIRTINSHVAYDALRLTRASVRQQNQPIVGEQLASGLLRYSERGLAYVDEIKSMIRHNNLRRFTRIYQV